MVVGLVVGGSWWGGAPVANAELSGACSASATFRGSGATIDVAGDQLITVPRDLALDWRAGSESPPGAYRGEIWIEAPSLFGPGRIALDEWAGDSRTTSNAGDTEIDIPDLVPGGVEFAVAAEHVDQNGVCAGRVRLQVEGSIWNLVTIVSLVATLVSGGLLVLLAWPIVKGTTI